MGHYDFDTDAINILGETQPIYTLWCTIMLSPAAYVDDAIDKSGTLLHALSTKKLEAVRMYFREGYVNFEVPDAAIFNKLLARLHTLAPY